ncbi:hypothetical protein EAD89_04260 [Micromonospora sp. BL4]|nr:hypothetical protein EAD89_04260 [Micromonospora sp. BL4]
MQRFFGNDRPPGSASSPAGAAAPGHGYTVGIANSYKPGQSFALPEPLTDGSRAAPLLLGFADFTRGMTDFLREQHGAAQSDLSVTMTFTGTSERPTRIAGLRVATVQRLAPMDGTVIRTYSGSDHPPINVVVDLDGPMPDVAQSGRPYFNDHQTDVTSSDREPFRVTFTGQRHSYQWVMAVDAIGPDGNLLTSYFGTTGQLVDRPERVPQSEAFRLTGPAPSYKVEYSNAGSGSAFHLVRP